MTSEETIKRLLAESCGTDEVLVPGADLEPWMDSLAVILFLEGLEDLGIELQPTQIPREAFYSLERILDLCRRAENHT